MHIQEDARTKLNGNQAITRSRDVIWTFNSRSVKLPEAAIIKSYENNILDQIANFISIKTEYRWS